MSTEGFKRKLAAIFSADVVGYSRLMGEDEMATVSTITVYREVMSTLIKQHRGRLVDSPGDNVLAEFSSVVDAAQCAVAVQKEFQSRNSELPEERRMQFRIGINLGDVIEEGERIYGDGVNIAARLEAIADPGGICISKTAFDHIESKLPLGYEYIGEQTVKNIAKPVSAYKVLMDPRVITSADSKKKRDKSLMSKKPVIAGGIGLLIIIALIIGRFLFQSSGSQTGQGPDERPSIAILPFKNMSGDPEQESFSDGITEELINVLAKVKGLRVVSQTSSFYFKDKNIDLHTIGEKLNVDHVLEGSVRKSENKLRITAQLINVDTDTHLWSETYDREMKDIFDIQDEISLAVATQLKVELLGPEKKPSIDSYIEEIGQGIKEYDSRFGIREEIDDEEIITGGLLACALDLEMTGSVKGGLKAYGASVLISGNSQDAVEFGGVNVTLSGNFQDTVKGIAVNLVISGTFEKDVEVRAHTITIAPTAVIKGTLAYSARKFKRAEESQITGKVMQLNTEDWEAWIQDASVKQERTASAIGRVFRIMSFILIFILGLIVYYVLPKQAEAVVSTISDAPMKSMVIGVLSLIAVPLVIIIFSVTLIGIPIGIIAAFLYILMLFIGRVYIGLWVGKKILGYFRASFSEAFFWPFTAGIILVGLLSLIPIFGWLLKTCLMLIGVGAMWLVIWEAYREDKKAVESEAPNEA
jgi:TolB-like protein/class 3 adenylate cyclase